MRTLQAFGMLLTLIVPSLGAWAEEAGDARIIALPRDGLSIEVPADWEILQYTGAVLKLTRGKALVQMRRAASGGPAAAERIDAAKRRASALIAGETTPQPEKWKVPGATAATTLSFGTADEARIVGAIDLPTGPGFDVEARVPKGEPAVQRSVGTMLCTVNVHPFAHPDRHVDWRDGWTLDVPREWTLREDAQGIARFRSPGERPCGIRVTARTAGDDATPAQAARAELDAALARLEAKGLHMALVPDSLRAGERTLRDGVRARRVTAAASGTRGRAAGLHIQLEAVATSDLLLLLARPGADDGVLAAGREVALTLREGRHPGPRLGGAARRGFKRHGAPPVQFVVPQGWTLNEVDQPMRLATLQVPGPEELEVIVYWFGAGKGGDLASNMTRWKTQVHGDDAPKEETIDVAPHVKATILDTRGTYVSKMRPGAGHPDIERDHRLLATFLAVPHGPLFVKLLGPEDAVGKVAGAYRAWIRSFRVVRPAKPQ